eukprot:794624-Prymnesium_polylepis.1
MAAPLHRLKICDRRLLAVLLERECAEPLPLLIPVLHLQSHLVCMAARAPPALEDVVLGGLDRLVESLDDCVVCLLRAARVARVLRVVRPRPVR